MIKMSGSCSVCTINNKDSGCTVQKTIWAGSAMFVLAIRHFLYLYSLKQLQLACQDRSIDS